MMLEVCLLSGIVAGALSGFFGIGGGVVVVPLLYWLFVHYDVMPVSSAMKAAIATSLAVMIMTLLSALRAHHRQQSVRWDFCQPMLLPIMLGALAGTGLASLLPAAWLRTAFGIFMGCLGGKFLFWREVVVRRAAHPPRSLPVLRAVSLGAGTVAGLLGVSGGVMLGPFFLRSGLSVPEAAGTSVACGLVIGICATAGFLLAGWLGDLSLSAGTGYIYWPAFCGVSLGSMLSAPLGARLTHVLPRTAARRILGMLLLGVSLSMFMSLE